MTQPPDPQTVLRRRIETQGYTGLPDGQLAALDPWLRLTPFVTGIVTAMSALMASSLILAVTAASLALGAILPRHPVDIMYNRFIRRLENSPQLPATPLPRRLSYAVLCALLLAAAWCLESGHDRLGTALAWVAAMELALVAAHQLCLICEALKRLRGRR